MSCASAAAHIKNMTTHVKRTGRFTVIRQS
jgi:hypothetical protein